MVQAPFLGGPHLLDSVTFPVAHCPACARDVLVARDLDDDDAWVQVCTRCDAVLDGSVKRYASTSMTMLGYALGDQEGCGTGGCGSCGS